MTSGVVTRRKLLLGAGAALASSAVGATSRPPTYFVSAAGNDAADGLTAATAWATIAKVNAALPGGAVALFRRGDTFYGELSPQPDCVIGAYGSGPKPIVSMYKRLNQVDGWVEHSRNLWKIELGSPLTHGGHNATTDANIGHIVADGAVKANKKKHVGELAAAWDFWCDTANATLYVVAPSNPTQLASDIKAAPRGNHGAVVRCLAGPLTIRDLHITGSGGHGVSGSCSDVKIHDCAIDYIGGSFLPGFGDGRVRYGNGIENWIGAKRWTIESNAITQVYDAAYTCQGATNPGASGWEDIIVKNNYIHDCTQSFEFWSSSGDRAGGAGFQRILIEGNRCERAGYSVFGDARPNQEVRVHLLTYQWELPADITVQYNLFHGAYSAYSYHLSHPTGLLTRNNDVYLRRGTRLEYQRDETVEDAARWQTRTGLEAGSSIHPL